MSYSSNNPIKRFFTLMIVVTILAGCTAYYKTSDVKKSFTKALTESQKIYVTISKDLQEKQTAYTQLTTHLKDPDVIPYPEMQQLVQDMSRKRDQTGDALKKLEELKADLYTLTKGLKEIKSNEPTWAAYKALKADFDAATGVYELRIQEYNQLSNSFISLANKHEISKIKVSEIKQLVSKYMTDLDKSIAEIRKGIATNRQEVAQAEKQGAKSNQIQIFADQLTAAETILVRIEAKRQEMAGMLQKFDLEVGIQQEIWVGPGMQTYSIVNDITTLGDEISAEGKKLNALK